MLTHARKSHDPARPEIRQGYLDVAAAVLGHRLGTVTEVYAEADFRKAIDVMRQIG
jgi:hypothetical protein